MDIRTMQYYLAVVREGTISAAAEALHVAQPSLSRQMKELEEELGASLFIRGNRKITLTEEGMVLRKRAEEMIRLMQMTEEEISQIKNHISGSVRIGAGESYSFHYLSRTAASLANDHPDIRFHITSGDTQDLMDELKILKASVRPHEILLVVDALTGQDAVNIADGFNQALGVDGIIMTKMDGDSRGGAALSVKSVTGKPIKFMGTGEKYNALEPFHPDRIASRILGMGDVMSLIEQAENAFDEEETKKLEEKIRRNKFDLEDFLGQMRQINKLGGLSKLIDMIPGISAAQKKDIDFEAGRAELKKWEAIILSMTPLESAKPNVLNASRRKRIAKGSGHTVQDVNQLIKKYEEMKKMTKVMANPDSKKARSMMRNLGF